MVRVILAHHGESQLGDRPESDQPGDVVDFGGLGETHAFATLEQTWPRFTVVRTADPSGGAHVEVWRARRSSQCGQHMPEAVDVLTGEGARNQNRGRWSRHD